MSQSSNILWTDASWSPITGCTKVSAGCRYCYAEIMAHRIQMMGGPAARKYVNGFKVTTHWDVIPEPGSWRKPRKVFVCSMSDLFHAEVPDTFVLGVFQAMHRAPHHTYQILTKRPDRMLEIEKLPGFPGWLPTMWMGVTIESADYGWRADRLRQCRAAVKWVSAEPLVGPLTGLDLTDIDWLVIGGESGMPGTARQMPDQWVDEAIRLADDHGAAVFVKQMGTFWAHAHRAKGHGKDMTLWPERFRRREFPR